MRTPRLGVIGLEAFLIVAMFDWACAQGTSQFKSPFEKAFDLVDRTCPWSMPEWACCCPDHYTFLNLTVSGTRVEAIATAKFREPPKIPAAVDPTDLPESLQYLFRVCSQAGPSVPLPGVTVLGTTDEPRRLSRESILVDVNDETSTAGTTKRRFQLSHDNSRLYWTLELTTHAYDISMACSYARSPSTHNHAVPPPTCTSSASALFNPPTMATLPAAFALAYLFQAAMALAC